MARSPKQRKAKSKSNDRGKLRVVTVLIPLAYNDGTLISMQILDSIQEEMFLAFHGWTIEGTVRGAYRMQSGAKCVENLLKVSIVLDDTQIPEIEAMVAKWCSRLRQEVMLLNITESVVKFIPPTNQSESS